METMSKEEALASGVSEKDYEAYMTEYKELGKETRFGAAFQSPTCIIILLCIGLFGSAFACALIWAYTQGVSR